MSIRNRISQVISSVPAGSGIAGYMTFLVKQIFCSRGGVIIGRETGAGAAQEITVGDGLQLSAGVLSAVGGDGSGDALKSLNLDQFASVTQGVSAVISFPATGTHSGTNTGDQFSFASLTTTGTTTFASGTTFSFGTGVDIGMRTALGLTALATTTPGTGVSTALAIAPNTTGGFATYPVTGATGGIQSDITGLTGATEVDNIVAITTAGFAAIADPLVSHPTTIFNITDAPAPSGSGDALVANSLDQFANVTQTAGKTLAITDSTTLNGGTHSGTNTGDQNLSVYAPLVSPSFTTPVLGTPTSGNFSTGSFTWPTFNQSTTGAAGSVTGATADATASKVVIRDSNAGASFGIVTMAGADLKDISSNVVRFNLSLQTAATGGYLFVPDLAGTGKYIGITARTDGAPDKLGISGQTGKLTFTGLTSTDRIKTVGDTADTLLELGGSYTPTGTWTSMTLVTPALGTPASGTLTNCTGLPSAGISDATDAATASKVVKRDTGAGASFATVNTIAFNTTGAVAFNSGTTFSFATGIDIALRSELSLTALATTTPGTGVTTALAIEANTTGGFATYPTSGGGGVVLQEDGSAVDGGSTTATLNFIGASLTAAGTGTTKTITGPNQVLNTTSSPTFSNLTVSGAAASICGVNFGTYAASTGALWANSVNALRGGAFGFSDAASRGTITAPGDGIWTFKDSGTSWNRMQFGGTTSSYPAIKRNGAAITIRLADDSGNAPLTALNLIATGSIQPGSFTVATVPSAATSGAGAMIYVSNESGGAVIAQSNGTVWQRLTDLSTIS